MNLPFHKYTGPGNKLKNGKPIDHDDEISEHHDQRYNDAKTFEDIQEADVDAIFEYLNFRGDTSKNYVNPIHNAIGATGLSIKHLAEKALGKSIYPFNLPGNYE